MPTVAQDVAAIRTAVYGRDVREAIADGIENCYSDVSRAKTLADQAVADATQANNTAAQGVNNLSQTIADANTATQRANDAAVAADTAKDDANAATAAANQAVQNLTGQVNDAIAQLPNAVNEAIGEETAKFARVDGYYQEMTSGNAEQLISSQFAKDKAIYAFRKAGGTKDVGNRAYLDKIVGGTVAWNQLISPKTRTETNNVVYTWANDRYTMSGTASQAGGRLVGITNSFIDFANHVYLSIINKSGTIPDLIISNTATSAVYKNISNSTVFKVNEAFKGIVGGNLASGTVYDGWFAFYIVDLTQMFGSAVADYIYSLEQSNAGSGAAWFRKLFPNDYYEYNAGELVSVEGLQKRKTVGFNLWDGTYIKNQTIDANGEPAARNGWSISENFIPVLPNTAYHYENVGQIAGFKTNYYDANKKFIGSWAGGFSAARTDTTPDNCRFIRLQFMTIEMEQQAYVVNLSWSGTRNGEYAAYEEHEYPLDSSLTLRGIPKLSADNQLYFDGDEYLPEGKVNRRYGVVDLGTLTWKKHTDTGLFNANIANMPINTAIVCTKYTYYNASQYIANIPEKSIWNRAMAFSTNNVVINDPAYSDAASFKTAMSGVMLVYELATPTEEEAEPFTEVQIVNDWGTEEFISDSIVPVGHETRYPANLRDKLQHLPDLASADGNYLIQQSGSQMTLVPSKVPQAPTANGTYVLKVIVSGGTPTYKWEAAT